MTSVSSHYLACPWPINPNDQRAGGIDSVFGAEITRAIENGTPLVVFSLDKEPWRSGSVEIRPADPGEFPTGYFKGLFGVGYWPVIHSAAHSATAAEQDVLSAMFEASESSHDLGSVARLVEHCDRHFQQLNDPDFVFNRRFSRLFEEIPAAAEGLRPHVHFQDFFTAPSALMHADMLREKGAYLTFHHHETVHPGLGASIPGRRLLEAMAKCDVVYVHTDRFRDALEVELEQALRKGHLSGQPPVKRFDLGISPSRWDQMLGIVTPENYETAIPDFSSLSVRQQEFAHAILSSRLSGIPHRFACFDRIDPNKGTNTVVEAIRLFLNEELAAGKSLDELRKSYRFFGLHDLITVPAEAMNDPHALNHSYLKLVREKWHKLESDFPGICYFSEPFAGKQRIALPAFFHGCHCLAGGADDGMGLATMENAYVNSRVGSDTAIIVGRGAGFAIQTIANGSQDLGFFPEVGKARSFVDAFRAAVELRGKNPGRMREMTSELVRREILPRNATMLVTDDGP